VSTFHLQHGISCDIRTLRVGDISVLFLGYNTVYQRWPNSGSRSISRSRPLFGLCQNVFASSVRSIALRFTELFGSTYLCEEAFSQMKIIISRYRSRLTYEHLKCCLYLCLSNYDSSFSKSSQDMQCHASAWQ